MDKVLVDTSVWIEFFRKKDPWHRAVEQLMDEDRVCCTGLVLAELLQGARSDQEIAVLKDFIHVFPFFADSPQRWTEAGELSYRLQRKGKTAGLSDCYLAAIVQANNAIMLTRDKHFDAIKSVVPLHLLAVK